MSAFTAAVGLMVAVATPSAHAGVRWSLDVGLGLPFVSAYGPGYVAALPGPIIGMQVGGGRGGYRGHDRHYRGYGGYGHGGYRGGWWGPSIGVVVPIAPYVFESESYPVSPAPVATAPLPVAPSQPDPVIYPRSGQNAQQTEYDRQQCNRWATTQSAAMADAAVFKRAVEACMDGHGYSVR